MTPGRRRLVIVAAGSAALAAAHYRVQSVGLRFEGLLLIADHVYQVLLVAALAAIFLSLGDTLLERTGFDGREPLDRLLSSLLVGAGAVAILLLVAGLAQVLYTPVIVALLAVLAGWSRESLARVPDHLARAIRDVPGPVLVVTALMGGALLFPALSPPTDWDSLMYHLALPEGFLAKGGLYLPEDTQHVAFVGLAHMLYVPLLALGGSSAPALMSLAFAMLLPLAVYRLARVASDSVSSQVAGIAVWGTSVIALVAVTARVDVTLVVFLTVAHMAVYNASTDAGDIRWLYLGTLLLGFSVGIKYQAGAYVLALAPLLVWTVARRKSGIGWRNLALAGTLLLVAAAPWFLKNWVLLDAPFYPFLTDRLIPGWLTELYGQRSIETSGESAMFGALAEIREPFDVVDAFLNPERLTPEAEAAYYRISPLMLLLPGWLLVVRERFLAWLLLPSLGYVGAVLAISTRTNLRYLLPVVPPLTIAASILAVSGLRRFRAWLGRDAAVSSGGSDAADVVRGKPATDDSGTRTGALLLAGASLLPAVMTVDGWMPDETSVDHLVGAESRMEYLAARGDPAMVTRAALTEFGIQVPAKPARVLMMFEAREFHFDVPALQDPLLTNWPLLARARSRLNCLGATDITHVLVSVGVLQYYFRRGLDPETVRWSEFKTFAERCLVEELSRPDFVLYRVPRNAGHRSGN